MVSKYLRQCDSVPCSAQASADGALQEGWIQINLWNKTTPGSTYDFCSYACLRDWATDRGRLAMGVVPR